MSSTYQNSDPAMKRSIRGSTVRGQRQTPLLIGQYNYHVSGVIVVWSNHAVLVTLLMGLYMGIRRGRVWTRGALAPRIYNFSVRIFVSSKNMLTLHIIIYNIYYLVYLITMRMLYCPQISCPSLEKFMWPPLGIYGALLLKLFRAQSGIVLEQCRLAVGKYCLTEGYTLLE